MTIFSDIQAALGQFVGGNVVAGAILAMAFTIPLIIAVMWILEATTKSSPDAGWVFIFIGSVGIVFSVVVGWLDPWIIIFIALMAVLIIIKPFGSAVGG